MAHEILIVDDEPDIRLLIDGLLRDEGYETRQAGDSDRGHCGFRARRPSLIVLDVWLQGSSSMAWASCVRCTGRSRRCRQ